MKRILLAFTLLCSASKAATLCSWMQVFELKLVNSAGCGMLDIVKPTTQTLTITAQCWAPIVRDKGCSGPSSIYASVNLSQTGTGGCGVWIGGTVPPCKPVFSWGYSDVGNPVAGHQVQFEVTNMIMYALPGFPLVEPICIEGGYADTIWSCAAQYCTTGSPDPTEDTIIKLP